MNLVFLAGYFWPTYPKGEPLSFADYPYAFQMFEFLVGGFMVFRGSRQIAKSTSFCCRQQMLARLIPGFKTLYIVPRNDQLKTYQNKMREIEHAMRGFRERREAGVRKNLGLKEFENGASIEMVYVHTNGQEPRRLRHALPGPKDCRNNYHLGRQIVDPWAKRDRNRNAGPIAPSRAAPSCD